jgi:hypothetical protein
LDLEQVHCAGYSTSGRRVDDNQTIVGRQQLLGETDACRADLRKHDVRIRRACSLQPPDDLDAEAVIAPQNVPETSNERAQGSFLRADRYLDTVVLDRNRKHRQSFQPIVQPFPGSNIVPATVPRTAQDRTVEGAELERQRALATAISHSVELAADVYDEHRLAVDVDRLDGAGRQITGSERVVVARPVKASQPGYWNEGSRLSQWPSIGYDELLKAGEARL